MDRKIIWINKWINVDNVATSSVCDSLIYMQIYVLSSTLTQKSMGVFVLMNIGRKTSKKLVCD